MADERPLFHHGERLGRRAVSLQGDHAGRS
jgi:hypothetical protein